MSRFFKEVDENSNDQVLEINDNKEIVDLLSTIKEANYGEITEKDVNESLRFIKENNLETKEDILNFYQEFIKENTQNDDNNIHKISIKNLALTAFVGIVATTGALGAGIEYDQTHTNINNINATEIVETVNEVKTGLNDCVFENNQIKLDGENDSKAAYSLAEKLMAMFNGASEATSELDELVDALKDDEDEIGLDNPTESIASGDGKNPEPLKIGDKITIKVDSDGLYQYDTISEEDQSQINENQELIEEESLDSFLEDEEPLQMNEEVELTEEESLDSFTEDEEPLQMNEEVELTEEESLDSFTEDNDSLQMTNSDIGGDDNE